MPLVTMPDGSLAEMPDKVSPEQAAALAKLLAGAGPASSRESLLAARDAAQASANEARAAKYGKKSGWLFDATSPELEAANAKLKAFDEDELRRKAATGDVWDKVKYWGSVALGGATRGLGSLPATAAAAGKAEARPSDFRNPEGYNPGAPLEDLSKVGFQPKTKGEKYVAAATDEAAAALTNPGGVGKNLLIGTTSGLGSEGAAQTFGDNAITRIVGAILGGGAPTLAMSLKPNADKLLRQAVSQVPKQDWRRAAALERTLNANNIPHLKSQLLGDKSTLSDLVAVASTHPSVRPAFIAATEKAPEQSRKAFEVWKNANMPVAVDETRSVLNDVQKTAAEAIAGAKRADSAAWQNAFDNTLRSLRTSADVRVGEAKAALSKAQAELAAAEQAAQASQRAAAAAQAARDADLAAQQAAITAAQTAKPPIPGIRNPTGRLLTLRDVGETISNQIAEHEAAKAMAQGKGVILGIDGKPLISAPPIPTSSITVPPIQDVPANLREAVANAQARLKEAQTSRIEVTQVPKAALQELWDRLGDAAAAVPNTDKAELITGLQQRLKLNGQFITDGKQLNEILKDYWNSLTATTRSTNPIDAGSAKYVQGLISEARDRLGKAFSPIRAANEVWQVSRDTVTNPMQKGLTGQLAQMGGGVKPDRFTAKTTALNMVFPADIRQPDAIRELGRQIGGEGVGELLREHLSRSMEKAVKLTGEAGRMQQPFDFVKTIAGTNAQRQNLEAALQITAESMGANPAEVRNGFYKLMRAFESTKDLKLPATVDRAVLQQQAGLNAPGLLVAPQSRLGRVLWERATEKTFKQIADIVMSPDGLKQLQAIAKSPGYSAAGAYARSILSSSLEARPDQE